MNTMTTIKRILRYTKKYSWFIFGAFLSSVISVSLTLYGPILVGNAVDCILESKTVLHEAMIPILLRLFGVIIGTAIFQWLMAFCTNKVAYKTVQDLRIDIYRKINTLPLKYIDGHSHGDLISRIVNDVDQVSEGLLQGVTQLFTGVVTILGTLGFMLSLHATLTLIVVVITPLSLFVAAFIAKRSHDKFVQQQRIQGELSGHVEEFLGNQKLVKTFCYEEQALAQFEEMNQRLYTVGQKAQFYSSLTNPSTRFVNGIVSTSVVVFGALCAITGWPTALTVGAITCFITYAGQYTKPFNEITAVVTQVQTAFAAANRLFEVLDEPSEVPDTKDPKVPEKREGQVTAAHVDFSYRPEQTLIENLNLLAAPGSKIAIVGPTGCGKTTLINLLMRFYDVQSGSISIDGVNIQDMTRKELRSRFGMVLQETWLYTGTVRDNIAYGKPEATMDEIVAAAKAAHAHSFIKRLPQGYDTIISENGSNLSQGQRQLLCIARVMLVDPPMLILDEATSNIDTRTEIYIQQAFDRMMQGRTSFIVAHRLSTIQEADVILVMRDGHIVEQGKHEELLAAGGFYAELYNSQFAES